MKWKYSISILTMTAILAGMGTASAVNMMWSVDIVEQVLQARKDFFMNGLSYRWVDSPEQVNWDEIGDNEVILVPNTEAPDGNDTVDVSQNLSAVNPLDTGKEILYYLFWTEEDKLEADVAALQNKLDLTDEQMEALKELGPARAACFCSMRCSPCTGMKYLGLHRPIISFCSSWQAWPDT